MLSETLGIKKGDRIAIHFIPETSWGMAEGEFLEENKNSIKFTSDDMGEAGQNGDNEYVVGKKYILKLEKLQKGIFKPRMFKGNRSAEAARAEVEDWE